MDFVDIKHYVYFAHSDFVVKIGFSGIPRVRLQRLKNETGLDLKIIKQIEFKNQYDAMQAEKRVHRYLSKKRIFGEWFTYGNHIHTAIKKLEKGEI